MTQLTITIPPKAAARLQREAEERGMSTEAIVAEALEAWVAEGDLDWEEDIRRLEEPGDNIPAEEAFDRFEQKIRARFPDAK